MLVAKRIEKLYGCCAAKSPMKSGFDFWLIKNNTIWRFLEIKVRSCLSSTYDTIFLDRTKLQCWDKWRNSATDIEGKDIPFSVIVHFEDGIYGTRMPILWSQLNTRFFESPNNKGIKDTGCYVVEIPTSMFNKVDSPIAGLHL